MSTRSDIVLERICQTAAEQKASEIYFFAGQPPSYRGNAQIVPLSNEEVINVNLIEEIVASLLSEAEKEKLSRDKQIIVVKTIGKLGAVQVNIVFQKGQMAITLKMLSQEIESLDAAGLPPILKNFTYLAQGIIFIVGPRDSGRFSLVASLVNDINRNQEKYIATVEEPIKYNFVGEKSIIEQREVGADVGSFSTGLDSLQKRNIDVIMCSDGNEESVLEQLLNLAANGSLVFTIFNAASSVQALNRIINSFPLDKKALMRYILSENLGGIITTRLLPRIDGGHRVRALEIVPGVPAIKKLIADDKISQIENLLELGVENSFSLDRYLADLASAGEISAEIGLKYCLNEQKYRTFLRR